MAFPDFPKHFFVIFTTRVRDKKSLVKVGDLETSAKVFLHPKATIDNQ